MIEYARALARARTTDLVTIPIVLSGGGHDTARLLLGPASQLTLVPSDASEIDLPDAAATTANLRHRIAGLAPAPAPSSEEHCDETVESAFPDFDTFV